MNTSRVLKYRVEVGSWSTTGPNSTIRSLMLTPYWVWPHLRESCSFMRLLCDWLREGGHLLSRVVGVKEVSGIRRLTGWESVK